MTTPSSSHDAETDAEFEAYLGVLKKSDALLGRVFAVFGVIVLVAMSGIFGYFNLVGSASFDVDLWLAADRSARPGALLLVEASSRDPKTGQQLHRPGLQLEQWEGESRTAVWPIQGELRQAVRMGDVPLRFRVAVSDSRVGELATEVTATPGMPDSGGATREHLGGAKPRPGAPGLHAVRSQGSCGWDVEAVSIGGVPVAHLENTVLFRVIDAAGAPVAGVQLNPRSATASLEARSSVTDADGLAVFSLALQELSYVEVSAQCCEGPQCNEKTEGGEATQLWGFEVQPVYDGLRLRSVTWDAAGVSAEVVRVSQGQGTLFDVRCEGELVGHGQVPRGGEVRVSGEAFLRYDAGTACVFQAYRSAFGVPGPRAVRPFLLGATSTAWLWNRHVDGVSFVRGGVRVQASEAGGAALEAWQSRAYARIRLLMSVVLGSSLILWLVVTLVSVRGRRGALVRLRLDDADDFIGGPSLRWLPLLLLGWSGIVLMLGGMWLVLWLMGL